MILDIGGTSVYFPYEHIYPEQIQYMRAVLTTCKSSGHALIEMPSGTGKTIALLASAVSYLAQCKAQNKPFKIVYCTRTVSEVEKTLKELRHLYFYISEQTKFEFLGIGLTKRTSMCINQQAISSNNVELTCRKMIGRLDNLRCDFYENYEFTLPDGVYDFESLQSVGLQNGSCPYFLARRAIQICDCIVYTYKYLIDPRVYTPVSGSLPAHSLIIFDEAHNIDSHCIEALSIDLDRKTLEAASRAVQQLDETIRTKGTYQSDETPAEGFIPYFYTGDSAKKLLPGNLRNPLHFVSLARRLVELFKTKLKTSHMIVEQVPTFVESITELTYISHEVLKFASQRLCQLTQQYQLESADIDGLRRVCEFATMLGLFSKGFSIIFEPFDSSVSLYNPILRLCCLDASIAISHVFAKFRSVLITSGTLSPIEMYPKLLNFTPAHLYVISASLHKNLISPLIITKGNDQMLLQGRDALLDCCSAGSELSSSFRSRADPSVIRNYGRLLVNLSRTVPDNLICFFPSYIFMEETVAAWSETEIINEICENKLIFIETPDNAETEMALKCFRQACDSGRGAILLSVARGKISEGIDFEDGYGRAVVMMGIPFMYTESVRIKERLAYLKREFGIDSYGFLVFDAMRQAAQCLGRVLRNKFDYGLMILADHRFCMPSKLDKLPKWIQERLEKGHIGLSIDMAMAVARFFYKEMAQSSEDVRMCLLREADVPEYIAKLSNQRYTL